MIIVKLVPLMAAAMLKINVRSVVEVAELNLLINHCELVSYVL